MGRALTQSAAVLDIKCSPDSHHLLVLNASSVAIWDIRDVEALKQLGTVRELPELDKVTLLAFTPDGNGALIGVANRLYQFALDGKIASVQQLPAPPIAFSFPAECKGQCIELWMPLDVATLYCRRVTFSPDHENPVVGDPAALFQEWTLKTQLMLNEKQEVVAAIGSKKK